MFHFRTKILHQFNSYFIFVIHFLSLAIQIILLHYFRLFTSTDLEYIHQIKHLLKMVMMLRINLVTTNLEDLSLLFAIHFLQLYSIFSLFYHR